MVVVTVDYCLSRESPKAWEESRWVTTQGTIMRADINTEAIMGDMDKETNRTRFDPAQSGASKFRYDSSQHSLGVRVIEAVGDVSGVDETEITAPLNEAIDPEALDALFEDGVGGEVRFQFNGYRITVTVSEDGTGYIYVE